MTTEPTTMMNLSAIAYRKAKDIAGAVTNYDADLSVVWGPAWKSTLFGNPYSLAFVARCESTGALTVVIRGTNPTSLSAWLGEDVDIDEACPFSEFAPDVPPDAKISNGIANALRYAMEQTPESGYAQEGLNLLEYLQGVEELQSLTVTGHSLGGTLTPVLYAWLHGQLLAPGGNGSLKMDLMSFAGLTAGNQAFVDYLDTLISGTPAWRVVNPLDVAPRAFVSADDMKNIYVADGIECGRFEAQVIDHLFSVAAIPYVQPTEGELRLPEAIDPSESSWAGQATHQHHTSTYLSLVGQLPTRTP